MTYILGIAGGSGSGKTTFARALKTRLPQCSIIFQDNYYVDQSKNFDHDGGSVNFDHPNAIDFTRLAQDLRTLKAGGSIEIPIYDFATHSRSQQTLHQKPQVLILVDGILIFHSPELRTLFDERIFIQTPENLRYQYRLVRDVRERGRTPEGVREQFEKHVKPMHDQFVEPTAKFAHRVICNDIEFQAAVEDVVQRFLKTS